MEPVVQIKTLNLPEQEELVQLLRQKRIEYHSRLEEITGDAEYIGPLGNVRKAIRERNPKFIEPERNREFEYWIRQLFKREIVDSLLSSGKLDCQEHYKGLIKKYPGLEIAFLKTYLDSARVIDEYCKTGGESLEIKEVKIKQ